MFPVPALNVKVVAGVSLHASKLPFVPIRNLFILLDTTWILLEFKTVTPPVDPYRFPAPIRPVKVLTFEPDNVTPPIMLLFPEILLPYKKFPEIVPAQISVLAILTPLIVLPFNTNPPILLEVVEALLITAVVVPPNVRLLDRFELTTVFDAIWFDVMVLFDSFPPGIDVLLIELPSIELPPP